MNILLAPFRFLTEFVGYRIAQSIPSVNLGIIGILFSGGFAISGLDDKKLMGFVENLWDLTDIFSSLL